MKDLNEMKFLARMARNMGQPDLVLEEAIRKEELLNQKLFAAPKADPIPILKEELLVEADPTAQIQEPAETNIVPAEQDIIKQTVAAISSPKFAKATLPDLNTKELDGIRKQLAEVMQKISTMSWGGGGTGVVRIHDTDDFDKNSYGPNGEGKTMRFINGMFRLSYANTQAVTSATYNINLGDYYVGVNYDGRVDIYLPTDPDTGVEYVVKDESGKAQFNPIYIHGTIDNDVNGAIIKINNGGLHFIYRNGWRII